MAVLPAAALAVHQLRFLLAFGDSANVELQRTGHSYLHSLAPWITLALALALGGFLRALGRAVAGHTSWPRYTVSLFGMWLVCSAGLVAIYVCQEFLEGLFVSGHPAGLGGIFGFGGWWAVPAALCVGLVLAAWFHGARWVLCAVACRRIARAARRVRPQSETPCRRDAFAPRVAPVAGGWSDRGPPANSTGAPYCWN